MTFRVSINDSEGRIVHNNETQATLLTAYFKDLFAPNFRINPRPPLYTELCYPIRQMEVQDAALKQSCITTTFEMAMQGVHSMLPATPTLDLQLSDHRDAVCR